MALDQRILGYVSLYGALRMSRVRTEGTFLDTAMDTPSALSWRSSLPLVAIQRQLRTALSGIRCQPARPDLCDTVSTHAPQRDPTPLLRC